jgi:LPXTG-motif cell wall-anchored protein
MSLECRRVPSVRRRIVVLLLATLLGVAACGLQVSVALAQSGGGAGDQQYSDPFGGSDSDSGSSGSGSSGSDSSGSSGGSSGSGTQPLTQAPQTSGSSSGSGSSGSSGTAAPTQSSGTSTSSSTAPAATGQLPNTGLDARVLVFAGVVLVLLGAGLRLRNTPERF